MIFVVLTKCYLFLHTLLVPTTLSGLVTHHISESYNLTTTLYRVVVPAQFLHILSTFNQSSLQIYYIFWADLRWNFGMIEWAESDYAIWSVVIGTSRAGLNPNGFRKWFYWYGIGVHPRTCREWQEISIEIALRSLFTIDSYYIYLFWL